MATALLVAGVGSRYQNVSEATPTVVHGVTVSTESVCECSHKERSRYARNDSTLELTSAGPKQSEDCTVVFLCWLAGCCTCDLGSGVGASGLQLASGQAQGAGGVQYVVNPTTVVLGPPVPFIYVVYTSTPLPFSLLLLPTPWRAPCHPLLPTSHMPDATRPHSSGSWG